MFFPHNQTLTSALDTSDTLVFTLAGVPRDFDEFRVSPNNHVIAVDDVRYTAPDDFTFAVDGSGNITLTWLSADTIASGKTLRCGIAYIDLIVAGFGNVVGGGGGSTDMTATNALLTTQNTYVDGLETALATLIADIESSTPSFVKPPPSTMFFSDAALAAALVVAGDYTLTDYFIENPSATEKVYLQMFNAASTAGVTLGTTAPKRSIGLKAGGAANLSNLALQFPLGLVIAVTTGPKNATAAAAGIVVNLGYRAS